MRGNIKDIIGGGGYNSLTLGPTKKYIDINGNMEFTELEIFESHKNYYNYAHQRNEMNLMYDYNVDDGCVYFNYRGCKKPIRTYYFFNGMAHLGAGQNLGTIVYTSRTSAASSTLWAS